MSSIDRGHIDSYKDVLPALQDRVTRDPSVVIVINCDKTERVEQFQYALDIAKRANPAALMIATTPKSASDL